jgi:cardiolipin synthase A/B
VETTLTVLALIALAIQGIYLFLALFEPGLDYSIQECPTSPLDSENFIRLLELLTDAQVCADTRIEPLPNGEVYYEAELQAMREAQQSIHLEAYIFQKGRVASEFLEVLTERARAGVKVRLVLDSIGSFATWNSYLKPLTEAGGEVGWYHPAGLRFLPRLNNRTHREIIVVDGKVAFVGGSGIADHWLYSKRDKMRWRDNMFRVEGGAVAHIQAAFAENWLETTGEILADEREYQPGSVEKASHTLIIGSTPSVGTSTHARILFQVLIASAQKTIHITTPYFLPDKSARRELLKAVKERGVEVRVIVPGKHHDHVVTRRTSRRLFGEMLEGGCEIYEYKPAMIHAKALVVDGVWSVVGSTNFDPRSFSINDEINVATCSREFAGKMEQLFLQDLSESERVYLRRWRRRPWVERIQESLGWIIERQQ